MKNFVLRRFLKPHIFNVWMKKNLQLAEPRKPPTLVGGFLLSFLLIVFACEVVYLKFISKNSSKKEILAESVNKYSTGLGKVSTTPFIDLVPIASPETVIFTEVSTPTPTPTQTTKPSLLPLIPVQNFSSQQIYEFTERFGTQYGVDPNIIRHIALCESGFRPLAKHYIYAGLFQFSPTSWQNLRIKMGEDSHIDLRFNAEEAVQTAAYAISKGKINMWPNCKP